MINRISKLNTEIIYELMNPDCAIYSNCGNPSSGLICKSCRHINPKDAGEFCEKCYDNIEGVHNGLGISREVVYSVLLKDQIDDKDQRRKVKRETENYNKAKGNWLDWMREFRDKLKNGQKES